MDSLREMMQQIRDELDPPRPGESRPGEPPIDERRTASPTGGRQRQQRDERMPPELRGREQEEPPRREEQAQQREGQRQRGQGREAQEAPRREDQAQQRERQRAQGQETRAQRQQRGQARRQADISSEPDIHRGYLRSAFQSPRTLRSAIVLHEVLDPPVSRRKKRR